MTIVDTGPLVCLFDPRETFHAACKARLAVASAPLVTTLPVLTEAFHLLSPGSRRANELRDFISAGGLAVHFSDDAELSRAFELMDAYADHPMDLADASVIAAAETLGTRKVFTLDVNDFSTYRIRRGHRNYPVEIV